MDDEVSEDAPPAGPIPVVAEGERWIALYGELRGLAHALMRGERGEHTLQTTALVHEAWLRLGSDRWEQRGQFMAAAARAMRCILTDHARARGRAKRGGGQKPSGDVFAIADAYGELVDLLALDVALDRLAAVDQVAAQIVELRFFAGMNHDEVAAVCGISRRTVDRTFRLARAYLFEAMATDPAGDSG
jgi:RNA polymerase sigma factor (TIGR02999 family)